VLVPSASNLIGFEVAGGSLAGVDNGRQESAENYKAPQRTAFNGKALAIIRSGDQAGPIQVTARADGLLPGHATIFAVDDEEHGHGDRPVVGAIDPILRTPVGVAPPLPDTVAVVLADGSTAQRGVRWSAVTPEQLASEQPYEVEGAIEVSADGHGDRRVVARVTPFAVAEVQSFATTVPVGVSPYLPAQARVTFTDGVTDDVDVAWDAVPGEQLERPGELAVRGALDGSDRTTSIHIVVSDELTPGQNLAPLGTPSASFSGRADTVPAALNNGVQPEETGWSNQYFKDATALLPAFDLAQPEDWVSIAWDAPQAVDTVVAYFRLDTGRTFPAAASVEYWDGRDFVPAADQEVTWATESEQPTTIAFDKISTTKIRLVMTSPAPGTPEGFVQISELQALGDLPPGADLPGAPSTTPPAGTADDSGGCAAGDSRSSRLAAALLLLLSIRLLRRRRRLPRPTA
jgi:beta-galactosidase